MADSAIDVWCKACVHWPIACFGKFGCANFGNHTLVFFLNFNTCTVHLFIVFIITNKCAFNITNNICRNSAYLHNYVWIL